MPTPNDEARIDAARRDLACRASAAGMDMADLQPDEWEQPCEVCGGEFTATATNDALCPECLIESAEYEADTAYMIARRRECDPAICLQYAVHAYVAGRFDRDSVPEAAHQAAWAAMSETEPTRLVDGVEEPTSSIGGIVGLREACEAAARVLTGGRNA